jgi:hypothetical protein
MNHDETITQIPSRDCANQPIDNTFLPASSPNKSIFCGTDLKPWEVITRLEQLVTFPAVTDNVVSELLYMLGVFVVRWPEMFRAYVSDLLAKQTPEDRAKWEKMIYGFELQPSMETNLLRNALQERWEQACKALKQPLPTK